VRVRVRARVRVRVRVRVREMGKVLGALADAQYHVGNHALAPAVGQPPG